MSDIACIGYTEVVDLAWTRITETTRFISRHTSERDRNRSNYTQKKKKHKPKMKMKTEN